MKRLIIVCEGPTESEFCIEVLAPALLKSEIYVDAPLVKKSNGGIVPWPNIRPRLIKFQPRWGGSGRAIFACLGGSDAGIVTGERREKHRPETGKR